MRRRQKWLPGVLLGMAMLCGIGNVGTNTVYAGDINSAESMIVSYYNGTFQYQGKTYVATEEAKAATYGKLVQDGVDLTASEARSAIAQANSRIADGIALGILVEVSQNQTDDITSSDTSSTNQGNSQETVKSDDSKENNVEKKEDVEENQKTKDKKTKDQKSDTEKSETKVSPKENSVKTIDINQMIEEVAKDPGSTIVVRQEGKNYQVIDHETGEKMVVASDGTIMSRSEMPLKTTEEDVKKLPIFVWVAMSGILAVLLFMGIFPVVRRKKSAHRGARSRKLRIIYSVAVSIVIYMCLVIFVEGICLYTSYAKLTDRTTILIMAFCAATAIVFSVVLWMQYHYKHRAIRYLAYSLAGATVTNGLVTIWLWRNQWIEPSSLLIVGVEVLLTIVCFRMVSLIKQKNR